MDYEKKYKEIVGQIKIAYLYAQTDSTKAVLEEIFPEIKESDDERIRKGLIKAVSRTFEGSKLFGTDITREEALAWLEKQGEQKSTNKVEPRFKVGDWIVDKSGLAQQVLYFRGGIYTCTYNSFIIDYESNYHLWTIQDAKLGDVIYLPNGNNEYYFFIFKGIENAAVMTFAHFYQYNDGTSKVEGTIDNLFSVNDAFRPATKEQRDLLFKKMNEAGYEWDAEKKELKKIEQKSQRMISAEAKEAMYDKPAWSEKDEQHIDSLLKRLDGLCRNEFERTRFAINEDENWLKSLKQRIGG